MIRFFRQQHDGSGSWTSYVVFGVLVVLIVGGFFLQMSMGICPVP